MTEHVRAVGYARVSTVHQADEGLSLEEQERRVAAYIKAQGWEHVETFTERGVSGAVPFIERPEFSRLLASLDDGVDRVVIPKLDRLGRSTMDLLSAIERVAAAGAAVVSIGEGIDTSTPVGKLTRTLLAAIAEFERDRLAERVAEVTEARARKGGWHGGPRPFGYDYAPEGGGLVEKPSEAVIVRRIFTAYIAGRSQRQIARNLNADGIRPKNGREWIQGTISKMLANPVYGGYVHLKGETYDGSHDAIVDPETWRKAEQMRRATVRSDGGRGRTPTANHVLSGGLLRCGCGAAMNAITKPTRTPGVRYEVYACSGRNQHGLDACQQQPVKRQLIDDAVWRFFEEVVLDADATKTALSEQHNAKLAEIDALKAQADRESQKTADALVRLERDYRDGAMTAEQWSRLDAKFTSELAAANAEVARLDERRRTLSSEMAQIDAETAVFEQIAALRAMVVGEVREGSRDGIDSLRAALRRLFAGFDLLGGARPFGTSADDGVAWPHPDLALSGGLALLPRLQEDAIVSWDDGGFPALKRAALALRESDNDSLTT